MQIFNKVVISKEEYEQLLECKERVSSFNSISKILPSSGLQGYSDEVIHDIQQVIKSAKNTLLLQAGRINKLEDIIYRNGGSDTCDVIIKIMNNWKKGGTDYDKRTGEVLD